MTDNETQDAQSRELTRLRLEVAELKAVLGEDGFRLRRLAELGMAQAKLNHDLRNAIAPAMMVADRLSESADPKVGRSGKMIVTALEQAAAQIASTLDFAVDKQPVLAHSGFPIAAVIGELTVEIGPEFAAFQVENRIAVEIEITADRALMLRAFGHMLRTAAKAQAKTMVITAERTADQLHITLQDDGRPFRDPGANPLSAFSGAFRYGSSGLGLVIARELIEAHGGRLTLLPDSGAGRTVLEVTLPVQI
ncbi:HAMP domain-containing histidine kinase [Acidisoma cellulosilytica]|uniref:histidine kinase n=1 Tax=Acidisoma cellulosilyticum TaxID=2802395 RepID=A0A963YXX8_9PROT|nr:HAMP domain-containing sensor histidine kinase [Acidisoma cellulosilyticum]MCB8879010.1 HAMP domain-containing histidine kinase [Acidisoma cellulosilyticum]